MSVLEGFQETKEDPLLGLTEDWKNWLQPLRDTTDNKKRPQNNLGEIDVKTELKDEVAPPAEENNKNESTDSSFKSVQDHHTQPTTNQNNSFETIISPGFTVTIVKEEPYDDVTCIFKESPLNFEKQIYHRQIFWEVLMKNNKVTKVKDLQSKYIECLRKMAGLEIFKCSFCNDYESMHKDNLKSHLLLVHKSDVTIKLFKCKTCNLEKSRKETIQKHVLTHDSTEDDSSDNLFNDSREDFISNSKYNNKKQSKYYCSLCSFQTISRQKLIKHEQNHSKKCDLCTFESESLKKLKEHQCSHQALEKIQKCTKFICYVCPFENSSKTKLKKHLFEIHDIKTKNIEKLMKRWQCGSCNYNTDLKKSFQIHLLSHKDPEEIEYFYCNNCDFKTKHKGYLRQHFLLKHKDPSEVVKKYMCEVCSHRFRVRAKLKIHMLTHKTLSELTKVEKCSECDYQTKTKAALYTHMELHRAPKFVCDLCGHQSRRKWNHEMHLLTHKKEKDTEIFRCTVCSYKTKFKARFKLHQQKGNHFGTASRKLRGTGGPQAMDQDFSDNLKFNCFMCTFETMHRKIFSEHSKSHDNPQEVIKKRFACEICGFRAHHKTHLHTHSVTHKTIDQVEPLKCEKCDFVTKSFHSLASHRQLHKEPKVVYTCNVCGLKNRRKYNHDVHLMTHKSSSEVPMIKCNLCSYQTKFKAYLREHLKKRHNILTARRPGRPHAEKSSLAQSS